MVSRSDCAHSVPVRSRRCLLRRGSCDACHDFVTSDVEREPTDHPWIRTTNKYYKHTLDNAYEKGIITNGITYIMYVLDCNTHIYYSVSSSKAPICEGHAPISSSFGAVIKICEAAVRCQISIDNKAKKDAIYANC